MDQDIDKLLEKYYDGETTLDEEKQLRQFFLDKNIPDHMKSHAAQFRYFSEARQELPSLTFSSDLATRLSPPQQGPVRRFTGWLVRIAAGLALLIVGFSGGLVYNKMKASVVTERSSDDVASVAEMKKMLAFQEAEITSASQRIQAINQSYDLAKVDHTITQLLINTLNFDPNVNVRLAACQALLRFENERNVKEALIQSLGIQTDPGLQITLIEALVAIKERRAVGQMEELARNQQVMDIVRVKSEEGLAQLKKDRSAKT